MHLGGVVARQVTLVILGHSQNNMLMYYINARTFFELPEKDWLKMQEELDVEPREPTLFPVFSIRGAYFLEKISTTPVYRHCGRVIYRFLSFSGHQ